MKFEDHCKESIELFGAPYGEVHNWLDEFMGTEKYGMRHRRVRHHKQGLTQVESIFGKDAVKVAKQHIISDLKEEGWTEDDPFPIDESHYVKMGLF